MFSLSFQIRSNARENEPFQKKQMSCTKFLYENKTEADDITLTESQKRPHRASASNQRLGAYALWSKSQPTASLSKPLCTRHPASEGPSPANCLPELYISYNDYTPINRMDQRNNYKEDFNNYNDCTSPYARWPRSSLS